ncbi:PD-(D/E)XK nuclease family protein [Sporomusa sphaeroides]|uniref:PD-(D/E)XK nuclease superfamily protein n=1 Tax=Sporomusa sphaeroides DSM 2875 TaxID=1337886 RepID=A0ABP2C7R0_9FIRM|nr:PD-(D/E)XK nuclease family protein [Sporomusa sphaeroides]OLS56320.1 PD-(D/E)XK nuclease superfamily protein [Sporomusa sphaeroides DSM 2875]CVK18415.1 PD-(D/E)XK nuclease superfamily protein [Sporomusa sphaeroides DSM 2875]
MIYSYSRLKRYEECPASFQYKYLYEMTESPTETLVLGKTVHAAIQMYLNGMDIQAAVNAAIVQEAQIPVNADEVTYLTQHSMVMGVTGGQAEQHFVIPLDSTGLLYFQGYIDWYQTLPDGTIQLIDWKTNRQKYLPVDNHQLGLYAWYLSQVTGVQEIHAELVFLRYPDAQSRQAHTYTLEEMEKARIWAFRLAEDIEDKVAEWNMSGGIDGMSDSLFPAAPGKHCQYCRHAGLCIKSVSFDPVPVTDRADAERVAAEVIRLEAALDDMKDRLKVWAKENGDIPVGDAAFSFVPSVSWHMEADKLYELCTELHDAGVDVFQYLTLTAANLKKMGVDETKLAAFGKKKVSNTFRLIKAKEAC